jgi:hypothetical protein
MQEITVTDEMRKLAETYFVLSKRGTNMRYVGPKDEYQKWYYVIHKEYKNRMAKEWRIRNLEHDKARCKIKGGEHRFLEKLDALRKVSGLNNPTCICCGEDDIRVLTINHKNGDGFSDRRGDRVCDTYRKIRLGRDTKDLEVRCYNCNILYEYEENRRSLPINWKELYGA